MRLTLRLDRNKAFLSAKGLAHGHMNLMFNRAKTWANCSDTPQQPTV